MAHFLPTQFSFRLRRDVLLLTLVLRLASLRPELSNQEMATFGHTRRLQGESDSHSEFR